MKILFITDYVCPYCLVAKTALDRALALLGLEAEITYQPFELTPPPRPRVDTYSDPVRREKYKVLAAPCDQLELPMKRPPRIVPRPYTRLAFEGMHFARAAGREEAYSDRVYRAYFLQEQDIGSIEVLTDIAAEAGLDAAAFRAALEQGTYSKAQQEASDYARQVLKPTGVPTIYVDGEKLALRDYTLGEMVALLQGAVQAPGFSCGEYGCG